MTCRSSPWYEEFFRSDYLRYWLGGEDTPLLPLERTEGEARFIQEALSLLPGASILDLCCGHGRHAIALAQRGYRVTGLDLSALHLELARRTAEEAGVDVEWLRADMRRIPRRMWGRFDAVINMFTAFGYLESDAEDQKVLNGVGRALKPGGRLLIDFIHRDALMRRYQAKDWSSQDSVILLHERRFDFVTGRNHDEVTVLAADGARRTFKTMVRMYTLPELVSMQERAGLRFLRVWGDFDGGELGLDSRRTILLAERPLS